jgi:hypothetical protein
MHSVRDTSKTLGLGTGVAPSVHRLDDGLADRGSIPGGGNGGISFFTTASRPALVPNQPPIQWVPEVKRPGREADHSFQSGAELKNVWIPRLLSNAKVHYRIHNSLASLRPSVTFRNKLFLTVRSC